MKHADEANMNEMKADRRNKNSPDVNNTGRTLNTARACLTPEGWIKVAELKAEDGIAVPSQNYLSLDNNSVNPPVVYTLTSDCILKCGSSDHIDILSCLNESAKKSISSGSTEMCIARSRYLAYCLSGINKTNVCNNFRANEYCTSDRENHFLISSLCSRNSFNANSGAYNSKCGSVDSSLALDLRLKNENSTLVSATSLIQTEPLFFSCSNLPFLIFLDNLTSSSSFSCLAPSITESTNSSSILRFASNSTISCTLLSSLALSPFSTSGILTSSSISSPYNNIFEEYLNSFSDSYGKTDIIWDNIISIKQHEPRHVYGLAIERTHNFTPKTSPSSDSASLPNIKHHSDSRQQVRKSASKTRHQPIEAQQEQTEPRQQNSHPSGSNTKPSPAPKNLAPGFPATLPGFSPIPVLSALIMLLLFLPTASALPQVLTFQGVLKDSAGSLLTGTYNLTFRIYPSETGGSQLYCESRNLAAAGDLDQLTQELIFDSTPGNTPDEEVNEG